MDANVLIIVATTVCDKHDAYDGEPCWRINGDMFGIQHWAVCNTRIQKAGFNGYITPESRQQRRKERRFTSNANGTSVEPKVRDRLQGRYGRIQPSRRK